MAIGRGILKPEWFQMFSSFSKILARVLFLISDGFLLPGCVNWLHSENNNNKS
jgi:hypothetical protein